MGRGRSGGRRRRSLSLSTEVWDALVRESRRRRMWVSDVAQVLLVEGLGLVDGRSQAPDERDGGCEERRRTHCIRLRLDGALWERLVGYAAVHGVSMAQLIREYVRAAVDGVSRREEPRRGPLEVSGSTAVLPDTARPTRDESGGICVIEL